MTFMCTYSYTYAQIRDLVKDRVGIMWHNFSAIHDLPRIAVFAGKTTQKSARYKYYPRTSPSCTILNL